MKASQRANSDGIAALGDIGAVLEAFGDDHMGHGIDDRDVGAGQELQVMLRLDVGRAHDVDAARIDDDELGALAQALLHARGEDRMAIGRIGADHHDDVGLPRRDLKSCVPAEVPKVCDRP